MGHFSCQVLTVILLLFEQFLGLLHAFLLFIELFLEVFSMLLLPFELSHQLLTFLFLLQLFGCLGHINLRVLLRYIFFRGLLFLHLRSLCITQFILYFVILWLLLLLNLNVYLLYVLHFTSLGLFDFIVVLELLSRLIAILLEPIIRGLLSLLAFLLPAETTLEHAKHLLAAFAH